MYCKPIFESSMKKWYTLYKNRPCILFIRVVVTHKYVRSTEANIFAHGIFTEKNAVTGKLTFIYRYHKHPIGVLAYYRNFSFKDFCYCMCVTLILLPFYPCIDYTEENLQQIFRKQKNVFKRINILIILFFKLLSSDQD